MPTREAEVIAGFTHTKCLLYVRVSCLRVLPTTM